MRNDKREERKVVYQKVLAWVLSFGNNARPKNVGKVDFCSNTFVFFSLSSSTCD
jgi:hypothetical protein